jgi:GNAT superfamily N-acetyltransferase
MQAQEGTGRVSIRRATITDIGTLLEFRLAMIAEIAAARDPEPLSETDIDALRPTNAEWLNEHFGRDFAAWLAAVDGIAVASIGLLWFPHPPGARNPAGGEAYILNVFTRPDVRRRGIARSLMELVVREARDRGAGRIWLRASDEGRPLYESMGFAAGNYLQVIGG